MKPFRIALCFFVFQAPVIAQSILRNVSTNTEVVGVSAISLHTLVANAIGFNFPFYHYVTDSASNQFIFSLRQKTDDGKSYMNKAFVGAVNCPKDSLAWFSESNTYDLEMDAKNLFFSSNAKTIKVNKLQGFEEMKYPARLVYPRLSPQKGFLYHPIGSEVISCINLSDGAVNWTATISGKENWVDARSMNDSVLVVAASGLSAISLQKGVLWSYPLVTAEKEDKALTYSLADNNPAIQTISRVGKTMGDENSVTELSSNILSDSNGNVFFASKEKMIAVDANGKLLWELDLKAYPVSKMYLSKDANTITLVNFGLAKYADNYVIYGKPFVMGINLENGKILFHADLSVINNLIDFKETATGFLFAGKNLVLETRKGSGQLDTLLKLDVAKYGSFSEFIDGDVFYTEKEGFYVTLNFINDNPVYFKADNNKIYSTMQHTVNYECHFNEIYKREAVFEDKILLKGENKSLIISKNMELLATLNQSFQGKYLNGKLILIGERKVNLLDSGSIK